MVFYKMKSNVMSFMLQDLEVKEDFAIWDNVEKAYKRENSNQTLRGIDNEERKVGVLKYMKREQFTELYPQCSKHPQYLRNILIQDGFQWFAYVFGFK